MARQPAAAGRRVCLRATHERLEGDEAEDEDEAREEAAEEGARDVTGVRDRRGEALIALRHAVGAGPALVAEAPRRVLAGVPVAEAVAAAQLVGDAGEGALQASAS